MINLPFIINVSCIAAKNKRITPCICCCKYPRELPLPQVKGTSWRSFVDNLLRSYIVSSHTFSASKARSKRQVQIKCSNNAKVPTRQQLLTLSSQKGLWRRLSSHSINLFTAVQSTSALVIFIFITFHWNRSRQFLLNYGITMTPLITRNHTIHTYLYK